MSTSSAASSLDRDLFECVLCLKVFLEPLTLPCGHTFCKLCIARALESSPACPLCRAPCFIQARDAGTNLLLARLIQSHFPDELQDRLREAREDAATSAPTQHLGLFYIRGFPTHFPGARIDLMVHEPRYLLLMQRCMDAGAAFGLQASGSDACGIAVKIDSLRRVSSGLLAVTAHAVHRYRCSSGPVEEEGAFGLAYARVAVLEDAPPSAAATPLDGAPLVMSRMPPVARAVLVALDADAARVQRLRDVLAATATRMLSSLSPAFMQQFTLRHGAPPASTGPAGSPERWSYFLANVLVLPPDARQHAFECTSTLERLLLCYIALHDADARAAAAAGVSCDASSLELTHVTANAAFKVFAAGADGTSTPWTRSAVAQSLATLLVIILLLIILRWSPMQHGM